MLQIGKLLPRIGRFLSKRIGLIHTLGSKTQFSFAYESSGAVFVASKVALVMGKQHSNGNGFRKCTSFVSMRTVGDRWSYATASYH